MASPCQSTRDPFWKLAPWTNPISRPWKVPTEEYNDITTEAHRQQKQRKVVSLCARTHTKQQTHRSTFLETGDVTDVNDRATLIFI